MVLRGEVWYRREGYSVKEGQKRDERAKVPPKQVKEAATLG